MITKYDNLLWLKNVGCTNFYSESTAFPGLYSPETSVGVNDEAYDVIVDPDDNIYVTGKINSSFENIDFDSENPETSSIINFLTYTGDAWGYSGGSNLLFIAKYNPDGQYLWSKILYNKSNLVDLNLSFIDDKIYLSGNVYYSVLGGSYDFDFDIDNTYNDDRDIVNFAFSGTGFLVEYNKDGNFLNALKIGGFDTTDFYYHDINYLKHTIANKNKYTAITFSGIILLGENKQPYESQGRFEFVSEKPDICLVKYNSNNITQWVKHISGENILCRAIESDPEGNIYIAGYFEGGSVDFDIDNNDVFDTLTASTGDSSAFIAKYNPSGKLIWVKDLNSSGFNTAYNTITFSKNHIYIGEQFYGKARTFGSTTIQNTTNLTGCIAIYDFNGEELEFLSLNTSNSSSIQDISYANNTIYTTGRTAVIFNSVSATRSYFLGEYELTNYLLSTEELEESDLDIKVYPNPTHNVLHFSTKKTEILTIEIINSLGQQIITLKPNSFEYSIDISNLSKGVYFVKVNNTVFRQIFK